MIGTEQLAPAYDNNLATLPIVGQKSWDDYAGKPVRLRVVPWFNVRAASDALVPVYYSSTAIAGLSGMISQPTPAPELPQTGETGTPLVKTATGIEFARLRLLE